jgi:N-acetyl-gamma-glutamyl-phosphate/LysW-gamma-L-alpha-aminoadipyl-6-phosphate reductase
VRERFARPGAARVNPVRVSVLGASGYAGGEFLRLALGHPGLEVGQVTSREHAGHPVHIVHPNLRGVTDLRFSHPDALDPADVLVAALPHGGLAERVDAYLPMARRVLVDLSEDFRLATQEAYGAHHARPHPRPDLLGTFVYANPELHREELTGMAAAPGGAGVPGRLAGAGCIATATILALHPLVAEGLLDVERDVIADAKIGSSAAGKEVSLASHHPERAGAVRTYAPTGHRHQAEIAQELAGGPTVHLSATAVERVRGVLVAAHAFLRQGVGEADVLAAYRRSYDAEPFVRLVRARRGVHRVPDPRILDGSNYCDVGFALDDGTGRVVAMAALDNLVKGTAGHAMQALNLALGFPETAGLGFTGLHP